MTTFASSTRLLLTKKNDMPKMLGEPGFKYTEELKTNIVYLLLTRYNGSLAQCSKGVLVNKELLAKWKEQYEAYVIDQLIPKPPEPEPEEEITDPNLIYQRGMKRLNDIISSSRDPHKITSALKIMREMEREKGGKQKETIFDELNKLIMKEDFQDEK